MSIKSYLEDWNKYIEQISPRLLPLTKALFEACLGGKRVRGTMVMLGYELSESGTIGSGHSSNSEILKAALAFEIFQTAILAHDDIIDKSVTRRGEPTLYKKLGSGHYGISQAICLADIGFFLAFRLLSQCNVDKEKQNTALQFFSNIMLDTGIGQLLDIELGYKGKSEESDILQIYSYKTAYYTVAGPLALGAILGGVDKELLNMIKKYGLYVGIAFQIQDDLIDIFGIQTETKKDIGADIRANKQTLLYVYAKDHADAKQKEILKIVYGKKDITEKEIKLIKKVFLETGAVKYSVSLADKYCEKARKIIPKLTDNKEMKIMMEEITEYFIKK